MHHPARAALGPRIAPQRKGFSPGGAGKPILIARVNGRTESCSFSSQRFLDEVKLLINKDFTRNSFRIKDLFPDSI